MTQIIAHAGCGGTVPGSVENIEYAVREGADYVELDLRCLNGCIYLSHNQIDRSCLYSYIMLQDALSLIHDSGIQINCDLKEADEFETVLSVLRDMHMEERTLFTGEYRNEFYRPDAKYRHFTGPEHTGIVKAHEIISTEAAEALVKYYRSSTDRTLSGLNIEYTTLPKASLHIFQEREIPVSCWTVDEKNVIGEFLKLGVNYITTNDLAFTVRRRTELDQLQAGV